MLCTFCNSARLDNQAPCPRCGAPSPLLANAGSSETTMQWGNGAPATGNLAKNNQASPVMTQTSTQPQQQQQGQHLSLLPVPYQPQAPFMTMQAGNGLIPMQQPGTLSPALPGDGQDRAIYVPPMYTKPRAIIPRYRAISG
ncbi:MAG: hypothetical protein E6I59_02410, partial [Chloroflexi bacterium]